MNTEIHIYTRIRRWSINHITRRKLPFKISVHFLAMLSRLQLPFVSVLFRKSHLLNFISVPFDKGDVMEARIKSLDSAHSLAQLVGAKRIILFIVQRSYALFMKIRSDSMRPRHRNCVTLPGISYAFVVDSWCRVCFTPWRFYDRSLSRQLPELLWYLACK